MERQRYPDEIIDRICEQLEEGQSLNLICREDGMPHRRTVERWANGDSELASRIREARELGYHFRAEAAVAAAKNASDPQAGRLAFDAERWYLGKLSRAFREKPLIEGTVNVGDPDAFAAFARALEEAKRARAGGASSTIEVDGDGKARSVDAGRELASVARLGGPGLGQDPHGG